MSTPMTLRARLLAVQTALVLVMVVGTGAVAVWLSEKQLRESYLDRLIATAQSVATLPSIIDAYSDPHPAEIIQPLAEVLRKASNVTYVVVTDREGMRYSHPDPEKIGKRVSTDPSIPLAGETFIGTETGTLVRSWRVKVPIFDDQHRILGTASVGILENDLSNDLLEDLGWLMLALAVATVVGVLGSAWLTTSIRKRIFGLEPEEIATLLRQREATLHGIGEGLIAVDTAGKITLINDAARDLLDEDVAGRVSIGALARDVLENGLWQALNHPDDTERLALVGERRVIIRSRAVNADGRELGAVVTMRDHTELHHLMRELAGAQSLTEGLRSQAHEFSNRLHVISGLLELGEIQAAIDYVDREGNGGELSGSGVAGRIAEVEVAALLLARKIHARELGVRVDIDPESALDTLVSHDRLRSDLLTVVGNIVGNAVEAVGRGGRIRVKIEGSGNFGITLRVADSGPGIAIAERERIFELGVSGKTDAPSLSGGRGIGLALVRRIVTRRGGRICVMDSEWGGTLFIVWLPAESGEENND